MPAAALLTIAILIEVAATLCLRASHGFSRLLPTVLAIAGYATSLVLVGMALKSIPVSVAYAAWSAGGTAIIALVGMVVLDEPAGAIRIMCLVVIVAGVLGLNLMSSTH